MKDNKGNQKQKVGGKTLSEQENINPGQNYVYIPQATNRAIEEYGGRENLSEELIHDIKIYAGIVFHFTVMRKMKQSKIYHEYFQRVLVDRKHGNKPGYSIIKEHAFASVIGFKDYKREVRSRIYWVKKEYLDEFERVPIYTKHPIPNNVKPTNEERFKKRKEMVDGFLEKIYIPRLKKINYPNALKQKGEELIHAHAQDLTLSEKKKYTPGKLDDDIHKVDMTINGLNRSIADKDGRIYNIMTYIKRELRLVPGINLTEVDISSSQPFILAVILDSIFNHRRGRSALYFIKRIEQLADTEKNSSAQTVLDIIKCIKDISKRKKIAISQKYSKKNDMVFEKMMTYKGLKLDRHIREKTTHERRKSSIYVKKVKGQPILTISFQLTNMMSEEERLIKVDVNRRYYYINSYEDGLKYEHEIKNVIINTRYNENKNMVLNGGPVFINNGRGDINLNRDKEYKYIGYDNVLYGYTHLILSGIQEIKDEIAILLKATSTGRFYDFLIEKISADESLFGQNLSVLRKDLSTSEYERLQANPELIDIKLKKQIVKQMVMRWLNDDYAYYGGDDTIENSVFTAMMTVFPYITSLIFILRINFDVSESRTEKKKAAFHSMLSLVESEFIYSVLEQCNTKRDEHAKFLVGTVHDSFVVVPNKVKHLEKHIETVSDKMFGNTCFLKKKQH